MGGCEYSSDLSIAVIVLHDHVSRDKNDLLCKAHIFVRLCLVACICCKCSLSFSSPSLLPLHSFSSSLPVFVAFGRITRYRIICVVLSNGLNRFPLISRVTQRDLHMALCHWNQERIIISSQLTWERYTLLPSATYVEWVNSVRCVVCVRGLYFRNYDFRDVFIAREINPPQRNTSI